MAITFDLSGEWVDILLPDKLFMEGNSGPSSPGANSAPTSSGSSSRPHASA